jgi:selenocysteine-specific elongation factor
LNEKNFILATAGHVDHGKSALVKALTGIDPDRLPEEKARGITIEPGFALLVLPIPGGVARIGIVDVPGHEDFVKNMIAGVGAIDLALFVVAADDGWMPQSEEHLQILSYLGVRQAVVALSKIDLAGNEVAVEKSIRARLQESPFAHAPMVKTSVATGRGLEELKRVVTRIVAASTPSPDVGKPRLAVDRAFTLRGIGAVVTGTLSGGKFRRGEEVVVQPRKISTRIRTIQSHSHDLDEIGPGRRTALSLPDLDASDKEKAHSVRRGDTITLANLGESTASVDVLLTRSRRIPLGSPALKNGAAVYLHHGSARCVARVTLLDREKLEARESGIARLQLERPLFLFLGDRFIIRDASDRWTLAGGVILEVAASERNFRSAEKRNFLLARAQNTDSEKIFVDTLIARGEVVSREELLLQSHFSEAQISTAIDGLQTRSRLVRHNDWLVDTQWWGEMRRRAVEIIDEAHRTEPNRTGLELRRLREALPQKIAPLFDALVADLCAHGFVKAGNVIRRVAHQPALSPLLRAPVERIRRALGAKPFDPPSRKELCAEPGAQLALEFLRDTNEIVEIDQTLVLTNEAFAKMRELVVRLLQRKDAATVSELRQALGSSRRVIVPFLERLDQDGITRRETDKRVLRHEGSSQRCE